MLRLGAIITCVVMAFVAVVLVGAFGLDWFWPTAVAAAGVYAIWYFVLSEPDDVTVDQSKADASKATKSAG